MHAKLELGQLSPPASRSNPTNSLTHDTIITRAAIAEDGGCPGPRPASTAAANSGGGRTTSWPCRWSCDAVEHELLPAMKRCRQAMKRRIRIEHRAVAPCDSAAGVAQARGGGLSVCAGRRSPASRFPGGSSSPAPWCSGPTGHGRVVRSSPASASTPATPRPPGPAAAEPVAPGRRCGRESEKGRDGVTVGGWRVPHLSAMTSLRLDAHDDGVADAVAANPGPPAGRLLRQRPPGPRARPLPASGPGAAGLIRPGIRERYGVAPCSVGKYRRPRAGSCLQARLSETRDRRYIGRAS